MDDIFDRLVSSTSYLSRQLIHFIEDLLFPFHWQQWRRAEHIHSSFTGDCPTTPSPSDASATFESRESRETDPTEHFSMNTTYSITNTKSFLNVSCFLHGLMYPLNVFKLGWKFSLTCLRRHLLYVKNCQIRIQSFISRAGRTLQGSSKDIGWLQRTQGLPPVEDGTDRFLEVLHGIRNGEHSLPNSLVYLLIPGLFSNHSPLYFVNTKALFSKMGLACHIAKIHSEASVEKNAWELKQYIEELHWGSGKRVLLLGHSKGGIDAAASLSLYWSELEGKVAGLALMQSPYAGTPMASDILREGQIAAKEARKIMEFIVCKLIKGDMRALDDLTYEKRKKFITKHSLHSDQIPIVSFHTEASVAPGVLATMTRIAHAELPWLPLSRFGFEAEVDSMKGNWKVPVVVPLTAAMAATALHLWLRYGEKSDGLVTRRDAEVPGSVAVRLVDHKLDHAWMVYSSWRGKGHFKVHAWEMCEALLTLLVEIGNKKFGNVDVS